MSNEPRSFTLELDVPSMIVRHIHGEIGRAGMSSSTEYTYPNKLPTVEIGEVPVKITTDLLIPDFTLDQVASFTMRMVDINPETKEDPYRRKYSLGICLTFVLKEGDTRKLVLPLQSSDSLAYRWVEPFEVRK